MPKLELIERRAAANRVQPAPLFVHGGFHNASCWDENFLPWFASQGFDAFALSLRGHGSSEGAAQIRTWTLDDYQEDIEQVIDTIARPTILIGHSMGGVLAQRCFEKREDIVGLALLCSSPLRPSGQVIRRLLALAPLDLILGQLLKDPVRIRRTLEPFPFTEAMPVDRKSTLIAKLSLESPRAMQQLFSRDPVPVRADEDRPVLVMSGAQDWSIPHSWHQQLAQEYNGQWTVCEGAHDIMLDVPWRSAAETILDWLKQNFQV